MKKTAFLHTSSQNPLFTAFTVNLILVLILAGLVLLRAPLKGFRKNMRELFLAGIIAGSDPILGYTAFSLGSVGYMTTHF